ncbi:MAG: hypothetical protein KKF41_02680 [Actinobacteria bacterium]|nr:hypothetical protein [Actinomycetota bacterium]MBU1943510.1 hypothetical protein [Actinomycetota bacterium]MBU2686473.1 hypothetical protein [Actinomycetota bacterium]
MRKRQGRAARDWDRAGDRATLENGEPGGELDEMKDEKNEGQGEHGGDTRERVFSWFDVVRAGAQLTLDVIRVIREGTDLYRKLYGGKGVTGK